MKVCMLVHQNYYQDERVRRYATALIENGHAVDVLCPRHPKYEHLKGSTPVKVITIPIMHRSGTGAGLLFLEYLISFLFYVAILSVRQIFKRYDVVHVHNMPDFLVFAALVPRIMGSAVLLDIHDPMPEFYQSKFGAGEKALPIRIIKFEEKFSIGLVNAVIAANDNFRNNLITRGISAQKITCIRNFPDRGLYDPNKYPHKDDRENFIAIYPGTIAARYGLDVAIRGIAKIAGEYPQLLLWIVGAESSHKEELRDLVTALGLGEQVLFLPVVPSDQVPVLMSQAHVGIYPAIPDAHMDIAIPTKVLEFTVMGLPVISSDLTVIRQLFPDGLVYLFTPGDADGFAAQLVSVMVNEEERKAILARIARELLPVWHWQLEQQKYFQLIQKLARK